MQIFTIDAGNFLCDGGGIFGGVPKLLWERQIKADNRNLIKLAMRCLLIVEGNRNVLIETGAGDKLSWKFIENNGIENPYLLIDSLQQAGFKPEDITDVLHTHLHWDHCGGGTKFNEKKEVVLTFPNATYHVARSQWENALNPNPREGDAYFENDILPVAKSGKLNLIENECELFSGFELRIFNGHTPGMIVPLIEYQGHKIAYATDLTPLASNVPLKWISAYDLYPVTSMEEKNSFLREAFENKYILYFEHDTQFECATVRWDEKKGPLVDKKGDLVNFIS
jgi:glyoxylase-like metal-dependent hydrolase (beta-lactamase superfamily II)